LIGFNVGMARSGRKSVTMDDTRERRSTVRDQP
jgi:hypothetical protein